jgi:iron(III) transport system substrate-binding protein
MLKRGERLIGVGLDTYATEERRAGHPIATIYPSDGVLVISSPAVIVKGSPNPNAAKLFAEFLLGDAAQRYLVDDGAYAPRIDMPPPDGNPKLSDLTLMPVDYDEVERDAARVKRQFNEIFQ